MLLKIQHIFLYIYITQKKVHETKAHQESKLYEHQGYFSSATRILSGTAHSLSFRLIILRIVSSNKVSSKTECISKLLRIHLVFSAN